MKKLIMLSIILFAFNVHAASILFVWDANPEKDLQGYKIYKGNATREYDDNVDVGNVTKHLMGDIPDGEWFFAVTAYDVENESEFSNEVSMTIDTGPPGAPAMFRATIETGSVTVEPIPDSTQ